MANTPNKLDGIRRWYSGKALQIIESYVLPTLAAADTVGEWPKGTSRKVRAALNKQTVAIKFAKANDRSANGQSTRSPDDVGRLTDVSDCRARWWDAKVRGDTLVHAMMFGQFEHAPKLRGTVALLDSYAKNDAERTALETARQWVADFVPVAELVERLDATRPKPVYVFAAVSSTVFKSVGEAMGVKFDSIESPEIEWLKVEVKKGDRITYEWVPDIKWPAGTCHFTSKFAFGSKSGNDQCHACGHAIKNPFNWVPLLARTAEGPVSLWVGRDCAETLFGCKLHNAPEFPNRELMKAKAS